MSQKERVRSKEKHRQLIGYGLREKDGKFAFYLKVSDYWTMQNNELKIFKNKDSAREILKDENFKRDTGISGRTKTQLMKDFKVVPIFAEY